MLFNVTELSKQAISLTFSTIEGFKHSAGTMERHLKSVYSREAIQEMQRYNVSLVSLPFELACPITLPNILAATQPLPSNKASSIDHANRSQMVESIKVLHSMKGNVALWKLSVDFFTLLEVVLTSMMVQLSKEGLLGNRFKYHADGKIRIRADKQLLIPEVASSFDQVTQDKIGLDDLKAMSGMLAV
ncbi:hypothetical protein G6F37_008361 [Rhizopus arrhizus]|nr:hypothetical protein G6F38_004230 [Rhizopus arrhizus]KAG1155645.1 hypothetical protein G6F37_008361 [Rhizopus arrhizus]